jgi:UDP-3-O-[3-hydroxymyristoyl] glucosamine N-acyltransferase
MTTLFDFQDGNGPVPAHQHPNGGGWVADTATVDETVYVGPDAQVFGNARISDNVAIFDRSKVFGNAQVHMKAMVFGNARVYDEAVISGAGWVIFDSKNGKELW